MSKTINEMRPGEILAAIRQKDLAIIRTLAKDGIKVKKIWTTDEVVEMLKDNGISMNRSTVSRWANAK